MGGTAEKYGFPKDIKMKCCICNDEIDIQYTVDGKVAWDQGHNALPVRDGRCCSTCNFTIVLAARLQEHNNAHKPHKRVVD
jgi:hypothetical protein